MLALGFASLGGAHAQIPARYCTSSLGGNTCNISGLRIIGTSLDMPGNCQNTFGNQYNYYPVANGLTATLVPGATYQVEAKFNAVCSASLWLDANNNGTFEASEWRLITASSPSTLNQPVTVSWTVPASAQLGRTRLRVRTSATSSALGATDACTRVSSIGDTRDYPVTIVAAWGSANSGPYCGAPYQNPPGSYSAIQSVQLMGTTLNSRVGTPASVAVSYQQFPATVREATATVARGQQYPLYVGMGSSSSQQVGAWVDWNQNQVFEVSEYQALPTVPGSYSAYALFYYTGTLTVPATAALGPTRMRVRVGDASPLAPQPCATLPYGSATDFTLTVTAPSATPPLPTFNPAPAWQAARRDGTSGSTDYHTGLAVDSANGANYAVGSFQNSIQIGPYSGTSGLGRDGFYLAKYDAAGTPQWVRTSDLDGPGTYSVASTIAVALDRQGNIYVTGRLSGTARFGPGVSVTTAPGGGAFLAKYSPSGTALWARGVLAASGIGSGEANLTGLTVDDQGYASVSGALYISQALATDAFVARYDPQGNQVWRRTLGAGGYDRAPDLTSLPGGDLVVLVNYPLPFQVDNISVEDRGLALLRFSPAGAIVWARTATGPVSGTAIQYDRRNGGLLVMGSAQDGVIFDASTGALGTSVGSFVAHYRPDGSLRWQRSAGNYLSKLLPDGRGGAYLAGYYTERTRFGGIEVGGQSFLTSSVLVAYYDSVGTARWVATAPASTRSSVEGLGMLPDGTLLAAGAFIGSLPLGNTTLASAGNYTDPFLARLRPNCTVPVLSMNAPVLCAGDTLRLLAQGAPAGATLQWSGPNGFSATSAAPRVPLPTAGTYTLATTSPNGCTSTSSLAVSMSPRPATPTVQVAYNGSSTTLTSSAASGNQWYRNGQPIAGATGSSYVVNSAAQLGSYTVVVTNAAGCSSLPSGPQVVTASARAQAAAVLDLYPNPTPDGLVWVQRPRGAQAATLFVHNVLGETVRTGALPASDGSATALDLRKLPAGVYVLFLNGPDGPVARRLVVE